MLSEILKSVETGPKLNSGSVRKKEIITGNKKLLLADIVNMSLCSMTLVSYLRNKKSVMIRQIADVSDQ